jgi:pantetheine-phosphate adenylyltransferase
VSRTSLKTAVYPGTFDPITNGHLDIVKRASPLFYKVIITLALNIDKNPLFSVDERLDMIRRAIVGIENAEVAQFSGLVVDFATRVGASVILRGLRAVSDFEFEFQMALMNRKQRPNIDTVYLMPDARYTYLSSSIVKEVARHGGNIEQFVPPCVLEMLGKKFGDQAR